MDGTVTFSTWIQNARIVDAAGSLPKEVLPPVVLQDVVRHFHEGARKTRIFNHSINADSPCRVRHMSAWAAEIDQLCNEFDVLIVQSAGNIPLSRPAPKPGIAELISNGSAYPEYFGQAACRIANPAQSFQALTVGSVACGAFESADWRSFATQVGESSAFSRCGLGLWDSIKPEVVEYGGDCLRNTTVPPVVSTPPSGRECYPELIRSTLTGGPALERDVIGTSFAAPKVAHIAAKLLNVLPTSSCLLYRALIVQSARWPAWAEHLAPAQQTSLLKRIGYGIPDIERATSNSEHRATFITDADRDIGAGQCHVYQVRVPDALRRPGDEYDIRVEVTLSYVAEPRRTRRTHRGYLSTWLDWVSNRKGEELGTFVTRAIKGDEDAVQQGTSFGWTIESRGSWGTLPDVRRSIGTVQKDWATLKSNALPNDLCIAVRGHRGWSRDPESAARYSLAVTFEIVGREIPIYEPLRTATLELQAELQAVAEPEADIEIENEIGL